MNKLFLSFNLSIIHFGIAIFHKFFIFSISEIGKVRGNLFQINGKKADPLVLPEVTGAPVTLSEKVYVPIKEYPEVS